MRMLMLGSATSALVAGMFVAAGSPGSAMEGVMCQGEVATIVAEGEDVDATSGPDVVVITAVDERSRLTVRTGAGDDVVCVRGARSQVTVGLGDGDDLVVVEQDPSDRSQFGLQLFADTGAGADTVRGGPSPDFVTTGNRFSIFPDGPDDLDMGDSSDYITARSPLGTVDTGDGDDELIVIAGGSGQPISTGAGTDIVALVNDGGPPPGPVDLDGGAGPDILEIAANSTTVNLRRGIARYGSADNATITGFRNVKAGAGSGSVRVIGDAQDNRIEIRACDAVVKGGRGDDFFDGTYGSILESGDYPLTGACFDEQVHSVFGNQGDDEILPTGGLRGEMFGGPGDDVIRNGAVMSGGGGDDLIAGTSGSNKIFGGNGNDVMRGGPDKDKIFGGKGRDKAVGGSGRDQCKAEIERSCER